MISITIENKQSNPLVTVAGRLDTTTCNELDLALRPVLENQKYLIINLSECAYLSSAGIRILLMTEKKLIAGGGRLFLSGLLPEVFQVLEMAGLHQVFRICDNPDIAIKEIGQLQQKAGGSMEWQEGKHTFHFHLIDNKRQPAQLWKDQGIAGYNELGFSVGTGSPAEAPEEDPKTRGIFVTCGRCAGFLPDGDTLPSDFRIPQNPTHAGIFVEEAFSFGNQPTGLVGLSEPTTLPLHELTGALMQVKQKLAPGESDRMMLVIADFNPAMPSVTICQLLETDVSMKGARFVLGDVPEIPDGNLSTFLGKNLTIENIISIEAIHPNDPAVNPMTWVFLSDGTDDASTRRLQIEMAEDCVFEPHKAFLTRRLYTDSGKLIIKQIHGGYSAQTYQVTSFDQAGRRLRPTVLKIASRAMISRESDRCQKYALPYILNNSAIVLGTEFFGDTGALRYNFVGIGGELTQLKWLTHYYKTWPVEKLKPLFDKIFIQILNPWYGQPIREAIHPFRDHDPTFTFFPRLCETAGELFGISSDDQFIPIRETSQKIINPYWFLKHEYARQRDSVMDYYTSICHGDLNMQNILLDEDMNVYLIDFSETKPRSLISDFARLEAIFMVDLAPMENEGDLDEYVKFISRFYETISLDKPPANSYRGARHETVEKNLSMSLKMREYALNSVHGDPNAVPYCLALLEWILPIVCYSSAPMANKRVSMIVSGYLCQQVMTQSK
ncbi:MAG: anti-sigma factor antagonist [Bacteroidales bacterium]|nr:anti-sigma factor antagonist [Bacteroidales bacterium]